MNKSYFGCHNHTTYSNIRLLDCINFPEPLIDKAIELGLTGIAITDHECLGSHVKVNQYAQKIKEKYPDFKIGLGNEIYLTDTRDKGQKYFHFLLLAKNKAGYDIISELSSIAWKNVYIDRILERVPLLKQELKEIMEKRNGKGKIIATNACIGGELGNLIISAEECRLVGDNKNYQIILLKIENFLKFCIDVFGKDDFYLEIQPGLSDEQLLVNKEMLKWAKAFDLKITVSTDSHYLTKEERPIHKAYLTSKNGDREVDSFYEYTYLMNEQEVRDLLLHCYDNETIDQIFLTSNEIANKIEEYSLHEKQKVTEVNVKFYEKEENPKLKDYKVLQSLSLSDNEQERYWVNTCLNKLKEKNIDKPEYYERLEEEARVKRVVGEKLETCMFAYPNTLQHYINLFWECGSLVGPGRGSSCAALNHYLMDITQLDPIEWDLPFWRYLNDDRVELGDVDLDLAPSKIQKIFAAIREERGELGLVQVCTYGTEKPKASILTACRGYRSEDYPNGIDSDEAQYLSSLIPVERGFQWDIKDVIYGNPEKDRKPVAAFNKAIKQYPGLLDIILRIQNLINKRSSHASGVILFDKDKIFEQTAVMRTTSGALVTQFDLHDQEWRGAVKYDFLVTAVQDIIIETIKLLQEDGKIERDLSLRQVYNKYLHPSKLPQDNQDMWDALANNDVLACFQFDTAVGAQAAKKIQPQNMWELADANGLMRLMTSEKGEMSPMDKYVQFKTNIRLWYKEMKDFGLSEEEQKALEPHFLRSYGVPPSQEQVMTMLQDPNICGFSLAEANQARKIIGKKLMDKIPDLKKEVISRAKSQVLGEYVWKYGIGPSMGYAFSVIHALAYSFVALQSLYLNIYYNPIYWNTAYLIVNSGSLEAGEGEQTDYTKTAKALGEIKNKGIKVTLVDINKSDFKFKPDEENDQILFGLKGLVNVSDDSIEEIIKNRPYVSLKDFINKVKLNKQTMISLIKGGAFDNFKSRYEIMVEYLWYTCEKKKDLNLRNFQGLLKGNYIPKDELILQKRLFEFNRYLKDMCRTSTKDEIFELTERAINFIIDTELGINLIDQGKYLNAKLWDKQVYQPNMDEAREWIKENKKELLDKINDDAFYLEWNKYAQGNLSAWEMQSLCFYYHDHELAKVKMNKYGLSNFENLPEVPVVERFTDKGFPIYRLTKICGTCIAKDKVKKTIYLLTISGEVVPIKMRQEYFALFDKQISVKSSEDPSKKKVVEKSWLNRGSMIMVQGYRRDDSFVLKKYGNNASNHQLYKIDSISENGDLNLRYERYKGDYEDEEV